MKAHISIRSIGWGVKYGTWVGKRHERERIIKLLEGNATGEYKIVMLTPKLISEIKGEQK